MGSRFESGRIKTVTPKTAATMVAGRFTESGVPTRTPVQSGVGAAMAESVNGGCSCP
jgi:hypothetical protein